MGGFAQIERHAPRQDVSHTTSSGFVSLPRILDMHFRRCSFERLSTPGGNRKIHKKTFIVAFIERDICAAIIQKVIFGNQGIDWKSKSVSKIFANKTVIMRRMNSFTVLLIPCTHKYLAVICQHYKMKTKCREEISVINGRWNHYISLIQ